MSIPGEPRKEIQIGGQAVIEGVVMRGPERWALAVRRPDGEISVEVNPANTLAQRYPWLNRFLIRGVLALVDSLVIGVKSMIVSAEVSLQEEGAGDAGTVTPGSAEAGGDDSADEGHRVLSGAEVAVALALAVALFLGLFIVLPAVVVRYLQQHLSNTILYNLVEGGIRVSVFVLYIAAVGLLPDGKRLFEYHGAEHKVVHAYESGRPLTPEAAAEFGKAHIRCGTTFIVVVFVLSVLMFSLLGRPALWLRVLERIAIIPMVAAFSYEIIKLAGRFENRRWMRALVAPGLWLQRITTREPDVEETEVAIRALEAAVE